MTPDWEDLLLIRKGNGMARRIASTILILAAALPVYAGQAAAPPEAVLPQEAVSLEQVLERAVSRASTDEVRQEVAQGQVKLLEALGKTRIELRPTLGLFAFSNPVLLATNIGTGLLFNRRTAPPASALEAAHFDVLAAEVRAEAARVQARTEASRLYFDLLEKQEMASKSRRLLAQRKERSGNIAGLLQASRITRAEKLSYDQDLLDLEWRWLDAETQRKHVAAELALVMGEPERAGTLRVMGVPELRSGMDPVSLSADGLVRLALSRRKEVSLLREKIERLEVGVKAGRPVRIEMGTAGFSRVSNSPGLASDAARGILLGGNTGRGEITLNIPLRHTGEKEAEEVLRKTRVRLLEREIERIEEGIRYQVVQLRNVVETSSERIRLAAARLDNARRMQETVEARLTQGLVQAVAVSHAEQSVLEAEWGMAQAQTVRNQMVYHLLAICGMDVGQTSFEISKR